NGLTALVDIPADSARVLGALGIPNPTTEMLGGTTAPASQPSAEALDSAVQATTQPARNRRGPREGTLTFLNNVVENETGTVKMRITVPNADRYFWPGQFVTVRLILTRKENAVLIPTQAQQIGQSGPFVYVVNDQSIAEL